MTERPWHGRSLGSNTDIFHKSINVRHKQRSDQNTSVCKKRWRFLMRIDTTQRLNQEPRRWIFHKRIEEMIFDLFFWPIKRKWKMTARKKEKRNNVDGIQVTNADSRRFYQQGSESRSESAPLLFYIPDPDQSVFGVTLRYLFNALFVISIAMTKIPKSSHIGNVPKHAYVTMLH